MNSKNSKFLRIIYFLIIIVLLVFAFYIKKTHPSNTEALEDYEKLSFNLAVSDQEFLLSTEKPDLVVIAEADKILGLSHSSTQYQLIVEKVLSGDKSLESKTITYFEPIYYYKYDGLMQSLVAGYTPVQKNQKYLFSLYRYSDYREGLYSPEDKTGQISPFCKLSLENKEILVTDQVIPQSKKEIENVEFIVYNEAQKEDYLVNKKNILKTFGITLEQ